MRTTLSIDDDVLLAARERARAEGRSIGEVVSALARAGLTGPPSSTSTERPQHGFRPLPSRGGLVTDELIERIRDEEGV